MVAVVAFLQVGLLSPCCGNPHQHNNNNNNVKIIRYQIRIREQEIRGKLAMFFERRRGVFSVTDDICPRVFDSIDGSASGML